MISWLLLLVGVPAVLHAAAAAVGTAESLPFALRYTVLPALVPALLHQRMAPLQASLVLSCC